MTDKKKGDNGDDERNEAAHGGDEPKDGKPWKKALKKGPLLRKRCTGYGADLTSGFWCSEEREKVHKSEERLARTTQLTSPTTVTFKLRYFIVAKFAAIVHAAAVVHAATLGQFSRLPSPHVKAQHRLTPWSRRSCQRARRQLGTQRGMC